MTDVNQASSMSLAPGVVDTIISITANSQEGVASIGTPAGGFLARLTKRPSTSGITTNIDQSGKLEVTLHIVAKYGFSLTDLAENLRNAIAEALLVQVGVEVAFIDIYVDSISFNQA